MGQAEDLGSVRRVRRWRSVSEKLEIVQLTLQPGASVAEVARAHSVNANQVFKWRRAFERGELVERCALLPVTVATPMEPVKEVPTDLGSEQAPAGGTIHIEFPGRALISAESGADPALLRAVVESLAR
jgi:transposase